MLLDPVFQGEVEKEGSGVKKECVNDIFKQLFVIRKKDEKS